MTTNDVLKKVFVSFLKQNKYYDTCVIDTLADSGVFTHPPREWVKESIKAFTVLPKNHWWSVLNDKWQETLSSIREQFLVTALLEKSTYSDIKRYVTFDDFWEDSMLNDTMIDRIFKTKHKATWNAAIKSATDYINFYGADSDTVEILCVI